MTVPTHMTATALLGSRLWLTSLAALALCACSSESPSEEAP